MPDISNIQSFIVRDAFPDIPADTTNNYRPDAVEEQTYSVNDTRIEFDFKDGDPANGDLRDSETTGLYDQQTPDQGSRVIVDDEEYYAHSLWRANVTFTFDDGHTITIEKGMRLFVLGKANQDTITGDVIANPTDDARDAILDYLEVNPGVKLISFRIDVTLDDPLDYTTISQQNNKFCFTAGVLIETSVGPVPIENLRIGDLVFTLDNGYRPIRWIGSSTVSGRELAANPKLRPVRIDAGALGSGRPAFALTISPQHRVLVKSHQEHEAFGTNEVLVPAVKLIGQPGIGIADNPEVVYYHILLDSHEILLSNGAFSESLYLGPKVLQSLSGESWEEIATLFPDVAHGRVPALQCRHFVERKKHLREFLHQKELAHLAEGVSH